MILYVPVGIVAYAARALWSFLSVKRGRASRARPIAGGRPVGTGNLLLLLAYGWLVCMWLILVGTILGSLPSAWVEATLLVAAGWAALSFPHWLAWRVCGPRGWYGLGRVPLFVAPRIWLDSRAGARELYAARFGRGWDGHLAAASSWTIAAAAWLAEIAGDPRRADLLLETLRHLPRKTRLPRRARSVAAEGLAWAAAQRGEWERVRDRAAMGRGRGVGLVRRIADVHLDRPVASAALVAAWALAPGRVAARPALRAALARRRQGVPGSPAPAARPASPAVAGPHLAHLELLAEAAAGRPVSAGEVLRLARGWAPALDGAAAAGLVRRGLELGGSQLSDLPEEVGARISAELAVLAEVAEGGWSGEEGEAAVRLQRERTSRAFAPVEEEVEAFERASGEGAAGRAMAPPLAELERWLAFRQRIERLVEAGGGQALATAWHNGVRSVACNWGVRLVRERGTGASLAAAFMHDWSRELAERVGDDEIAALSAKNLQIVLRAVH